MTKTESLEGLFGCSQCKRNWSCRKKRTCLSPPVSVLRFWLSGVVSNTSMKRLRGEIAMLNHDTTLCNELLSCWKKPPSFISRDTISKCSSTPKEFFYYIHRMFHSLRNKMFLKDSLLSTAKIGRWEGHQRTGFQNTFFKVLFKF